MKKLKCVLLVVLLATGFRCSAQFGATFSFDGSTQSVVAPNGMMNGATIFTIELWIKTTENRSNGTYWQRPTLIGEASTGGPSGDFGITTDSGYIGMWSGLNSAGDNYFLSPSLQVNDNNWHHIAAVNDGSNINLFVDGTLQGSIASGLGLVTTAAPLTIGASSLDFAFTGNVGQNNFFHSGTYDEVRFSNNIRYTSNFTVPSTAFTPDANTVALYHLDGCSGGLVPDASVNASNAHPHNFTGACAFTLPAPPNIPANSIAADINKTEYFYDTDPGFGNGIDIPVTATSDLTTTYPVNTQALPDGVHRLYLRTRNANMTWSLVNLGTFFIVPPFVSLPAVAAPTKLLKAEYFYDTDPGFGNATNIPLTAAFDVSGTFAVNTATLSGGVHRIYLRTQDSARSWSHTNLASFYVLSGGVTIPANTVPGNIVKAEYFLDTDPGFDNATNIPLTAGADVTLNNAFINITGLADGVHRIYVRTKDASGTWSNTNLNTFSIVAAGVTIPPNPVAGNITKLEYFFDTDPGFGNGHSVTILPTTDLNNYTLVADVSGLNDSIHTLYIRTFDEWGITNTKTFAKGSLVPVTWLSFNAKLKNDSVLLNWQTANELNNARFEIQRSKDGRNFTGIGSVNGNGTSSLMHDYAFTDKQPLTGISYYRIRQVDIDGKWTYSVVVAIRFGKQLPVAIYPNPANDMINMLFDRPQGKNSFAELMNANGQLLQRVDVSSLQSARINVAALPAGSYELRIKDQVTQKIIIRH